MVGLVQGKIDIDEILATLEDHSTGAVALFLGRVRDHAEGRRVTKMDYEAYSEMALKKMKEIERAVAQRWGTENIALVHRIGHLELGEVSVVVGVACAHRNEAFEACRYAIDTLKETVPIWKKEYFAEGEAWVAGVKPKSNVP